MTAVHICMTLVNQIARDDEQALLDPVAWQTGALPKAVVNGMCMQLSGCFGGVTREVSCLGA